MDQEAEHEVEQEVEEVAEEEEADLAETTSARAESTNQRISLSPKQVMKAKTKTNLWTNKTQAPQTATKKRHPLQKSAHTTLYFNLSNKSRTNPVASAEG